MENTLFRTRNHSKANFLQQREVRSYFSFLPDCGISVCFGFSLVGFLGRRHLIGKKNTWTTEPAGSGYVMDPWIRYWLNDTSSTSLVNSFWHDGQKTFDLWVIWTHSVDIYCIYKEETCGYPFHSAACLEYCVVGCQDLQRQRCGVVCWWHWDWFCPRH